MKYFLLLFICCTQITFAQKTLDELLQQFNTRSVPYISVEGLRSMQVNDEVVILDSREEDEFNVSHIEGAKYVGYNTFSASVITEEILDKDTPIIVYCSLGIRSEEVCEKLEKEGYTNVQNLYGGIFEWKNKGYPILDAEEKETENVHAFSKMWSKWLKSGIPIYELGAIDKSKNNKK